MFDGVRLCEPSARVFEAVAGRVGATIAGRGTYEDPDRFGDDGTPHPTAPLFVVGHRPVPQVAGRPHFHSLPEHVQLRLLEAVPAVHQS
jgi:hypothetical protein